jgi:hypothetical protein
MTEQPPVTSENPQDSGGDATPPTQTQKDAEATARAVDLASTQFSASDHKTYSMALYNQPSWIIDALFASGTIDPNATHTQAEVQGALDQMMATPDKSFEVEAPQ